MSSREMSRRIRRAQREGGEAFWLGKTLQDNPYKVSEWGVGGYWRIGYEMAKKSAQQGIRHALYGNPLEMSCHAVEDEE